MKFEVEEIENDVDIPIINEVVRFATMSSNVLRAQFVVTKGDVATVVETVEIPKTPGIKDIPFFNGEPVDGKRATNARVRLIYTGDKYPDLMFDICENTTGSLKYEGDMIVF